MVVISLIKVRDRGVMVDPEPPGQALKSTLKRVKNHIKEKIFWFFCCCMGGALHMTPILPSKPRGLNVAASCR